MFCVRCAHDACPPPPGRAAIRGAAGACAVVTVVTADAPLTFVAADDSLDLAVFNGLAGVASEPAAAALPETVSLALVSDGACGCLSSGVLEADIEVRHTEQHARAGDTRLRTHTPRSSHPPHRHVHLRGRGVCLPRMACGMVRLLVRCRCPRRA